MVPSIFRFQPLRRLPGIVLVGRQAPRWRAWTRLRLGDPRHVLGLGLGAVTRRAQHLQVGAPPAAAHGARDHMVDLPAPARA